MFKNSSGSRVTTAPLTFTLDVPTEAAHDPQTAIGARNWGAIIAATIALGLALSSGNQAQIAAAIQALIAAITGQ